MASQNREGVKRTLLLGFVMVCLVLITLIWADGMIVDEEATPAYYRGRFEGNLSLSITLTAEMEAFQEGLGGTPAPEREEGHGGGQGTGQGRGQAGHDDQLTPTPEAAATP